MAHTEAILLWLTGRNGRLPVHPQRPRLCGLLQGEARETGLPDPPHPSFLPQGPRLPGFASQPMKPLSSPGRPPLAIQANAGDSRPQGILSAHCSSDLVTHKALAEVPSDQAAWPVLNVPCTRLPPRLCSCCFLPPENPSPHIYFILSKLHRSFKAQIKVCLSRFPPSLLKGD